MSDFVLDNAVTMRSCFDSGNHFYADRILDQVETGSTTAFVITLAKYKARWPILGALKMETTYEVSSGNIFADLGLPNSEQELVKAKLTVQIYQILKARKLTQTQAARLLGTTQAQVSALMRCRPVSISVGRLMEFLIALGQDVEVAVRARAHQGTGHMSVTVGTIRV